MKKQFQSVFLIFILFINGCAQETDGALIFGISAEYPPFEYIDNGDVKGFDIDLAKTIGEKLNKRVTFQDMQFSVLFQALRSDQIDLVISTLTTTPQREKGFDFSKPYYFGKIGVIFDKKDDIKTIEDLKNIKVGTQMASSNETWAKDKLSNKEIVSLNNNVQGIEMLKNGSIDALIADEFQGHELAKQDPKLKYITLSESGYGYTIMFKKGSPLKEKVDAVLDDLIKSGYIKSLEDKWISNKTHE